MEAAEGNYPPCSRCGAAQGDPCRTPAGQTTKPHRVRLEEAR
jgi:hypothetical protein